MMIELMLNLKPRDLYNWLLLGYGYLVDEHFWRKYCLKRGIRVGHKPWQKRLEYWLKRRPVWEIIDDTEWNTDCQSPKTIWGLPERAYIQYHDFEKDHEADVADIITRSDLAGVVDVIRQTGQNFHVSDTGFYYGFVNVDDPKDEKIYIIRYCPFDKIQLGVTLSNEAVYITKSTYYYGETKNGHRHNYGELLFNNGFILKHDEWADNSTIEMNRGEDGIIFRDDLPGTLEDMLYSYVDWCEQKLIVVDPKDQT